MSGQDLAEPANLMQDSTFTYSVFEDESAPVLVSASPAPDSIGAARNTPVILEIVDNAAGIEDFRKKSVFLRASGESNSVHGMGLGLSLVKKIIKSINGEIWVEDKVKGNYTKGSRFIILIPEWQEISTFSNL